MRILHKLDMRDDFAVLQIAGLKSSTVIWKHDSEFFGYGRGVAKQLQTFQASQNVCILIHHGLHVIF